MRIRTIVYTFSYKYILTDKDIYFYVKWMVLHWFVARLNISPQADEEVVGARRYHKKSVSSCAKRIKSEDIFHFLFWNFQLLIC